MTEQETIQAIRKDIVGELEAIIQYDQHLYNTNSPLAKEIWTKIRNQEMVHVGELFTLLSKLDPNTAKKFIEGQNEVEKIVKNFSFKKGF